MTVRASISRSLVLHRVSRVVVRSTSKIQTPNSTTKSVVMAKEELSSDEVDAREGLEMLLGGISDVSMLEVNWEDESSSQRQAERVNAPSNTATPAHVAYSDSPSVKRIVKCSYRSVLGTNSPDVVFSRCFDRAFSLSNSGRMSKPPVSIVDLAHINNRGYALIATRNISRGEVIYTERAAEACQLPSRCTICRNLESQGVGWEECKQYQVRGCQNCFRSLEPASSILCDNSSLELPMAENWPVGERYWESCSNRDICESEGVRYWLDSSTRQVQCMDCRASFCSKYCFESHMEIMGTCCKCVGATQAVVHATFCDGKSAGDELSIEPSVVLAARIACAELQRHRNGSDQPSPLAGICGESSDIVPLELGVVQRNTDEERAMFSLKKQYEALCKSLDMTEEEMNFLSLAEFERFAAIGARNGFDIQTKSPFKEYYSAICRLNGRNTDRHRNTVMKLARALGSPDGELRRTMDRDVEEKCSVRIVALFSLTARINHSCDPCAEVRSGDFVDCHIDLIARRDIEAGEEISISYINLLGRNAGRASTNRDKRRRELKARYLFDCDCNRCMEG